MKRNYLLESVESRDSVSGDLAAQLLAHPGSDEVIDRVLEVGPSVIPDLLSILTMNPPREVIETIMEITARMGDAAIPYLLPPLKSNIAIQSQLAWILGQLRAYEAVDSLIELLESPSEWTRWSAVSALKYIGDKRAREAIATLRNDTSLSVRSAVEAALNELS